MTDLLDLAVAAETTRPGVVACTLYRDGQRVRDVAVEEISPLPAKRVGLFGWVCTNVPFIVFADSST